MKNSKTFFTYLKEKQGDIAAYSIDVNDIGKIIINPIKTESFAGES
ncbi:MAG: hypothetical protein HC887_05680 [Desulfobacteraceae bacterium]|nr:hypothetical protein [Desulfobacteraceae bacterium]